VPDDANLFSINFSFVFQMPRQLDKTHWKAQADCLGYTLKQKLWKLRPEDHEFPNTSRFQMSLPGMNTPRLLIFAVTMMLLAQTAWPVTVSRGLGPEPDSLDIHQAQGLTAINLLRDLREGLLSFDAKGELVPGQAESWQVLDGGKRYRFTIRPDAKWSNGDAVTAADFIRAWHRAFSPQTASATVGLLQIVENATAVISGKMAVDELGIEEVESDILEITLTRPAPWFPELLAHPVSYPLHPSSVDDPRQAPVNGPFVLAGWVPRASISLEKNSGYHAAASVLVDAVEYFPIEEPAAELLRFRARELDITETIPSGRFDWLKENLGAELRTYPYLGSFWLGINFSHPALGHSVALRRALALAIDREILVRVVLGAGEMPGWGIVPPGISGYQPAQMAESSWSQEQREAEAVRLYKEAGKQEGFGEDKPLVLELRYNTSQLHRRMAVAVSAMWKQVLGVATELVNEEWKVFVNNRKMGVVTEVFRGGWIADYGNPASFLDLFISDNALNTTFYANPEFDQTMASTHLVGGLARMELLHKAESILMQDMPVIPLYYYVSRHLVNTRITGFEDNVRDIHLSRYLGIVPENP
jgi:oligopeptide transport system substrate-binding protein